MAANIRLLTRRIKTAKNIAQITRAMEMVSASKVRKAQERTLASKPYAEKLRFLVENLIGRVEEGSHPYLQKRETGKTLVLLFSTDKGLCGSLNTNTLREFSRFADQTKDMACIAIGKKLQRAPIRLEKELLAEFPFGTTLPSFEATIPITTVIVDGFLKGTYKKVVAVYTQFLTLSRQLPTVVTLLPIEKRAAPEDEKTAETLLSYQFEPNADGLLTALMPHFLEMSIYQIFLESYASEQASRMLAMHQASQNANDVIFDLSLYYNKVRQERITTELLDITGATFGTQS